MRSIYTGHVSSAEWRWVQLVSVSLVLVAFLPFLWVLVIGLANSDWQFMGVLHDYHNGATNLARVYQGTQDAWLTDYLHTPEPQSGTFVDFLYTLLGQLSRLINLSPVAVFHAARVGASLVMYLALYQLASTIWMRVRSRRIFFVFAVAGSGFGWLIVPLFEIINSPDLTMPGAYPFYSTLANVHMPLATACVALIASVAIIVFRPGEDQPPSVENGGLLIVLVSFILMGIYPVAVLPMMVTFALVLLVIAWKRQPLTNKLRWLLWLCWPALPMLAYYTALLLYNGVVEEIWNQYAALSAPTILEFVLGLGLPLLIALPGIVRAVRQFEPDGDQFMLIWLLVIVALVFMPIGVQGRFMLGIMIPIAYFATRAIEDFWFEHIQRRWRYRVLLAIVPIMAATHVFVLLLPLRPMNDGDFGDAAGLLLQRDYLEVFRWVERNTGSSDVVLASPDVGLWLPVWSGAQTIYGHPIETVDAELRERAVIDWYAGDNPDGCQSLLDGAYTEGGAYVVRYVLYGPLERELGVDSPCLDLLVPLHRINSVLIYRYMPQISDDIPDNTSG